MTRALLFTMVVGEACLRLRRGSTHVLLLVAALAAWFMVVDPATGYNMLVANSARVAYNSTGLALGSSVLATSLLGLFGFYLVRGRVDDDLRSGMGGVLATMPVSNASLILGRWAGAVLYLGSLILVLALTMCVLQSVRGEGVVAPLVYLQFYALTILPNIFFCAAMAVLCESTRPLMGKTGDVLYFLFWLAQVSVAAVFVSLNTGGTFALAFDATGVGVLTQRGQQLLQTTSMAVGLNPFDKTVAPVVMADNFWTWQMVLTRFAAAFAAAIPLALAAGLFHRFSPDRVRAPASRRTWAIGGGINRALRPLDVCSHLLLRASARLPRLPGQLGAELALTFAAYPLTGPLLLLSVAAGSLLDYAMLPWLLLAAVLYWGVVIADLGVRDHAADTEAISSSMPGGAMRRYWRQCAAAVLLGLLLTAPVMARWAGAEPLRAFCLFGGMLALTGLAQFLGSTLRTGRAFTVLFLSGLYIVAQSDDVAAMDLLGMHGEATAASIAQQAAAGVALLVAGFGFARRRGLQ
ncbi:hypothetical protein [Massilia glaciei]|uniref:Uncharacterized protein n=1 Tax=Massilia glaciei TaxID=1524097 RepID=A0A2U2HLL7_9BURK|nr:hypothetical protein [Massilia glaciei]PWF48414.1 hypothetical protein C7C56_011885 [Massilia glaciei]